MPLFLHGQSTADERRGPQVQALDLQSKPGTDTQKAGEMVTISLEKASLDEANAVMAIQGIVNRTGPKIFVFQGKKNTWGRFVGQESNHTSWLPAEFLAKYPTTDNLFEEYYLQKRGFTKREVKSLKELYLEFQAYVKGAVLYDIDKIDQRVIAFSFASAEDYIPVTAKILADYPVLEFCPVKESLPGRFENPVESQKWAYDKLASKCANRSISSYWPNETWLSIDHGISKKNFFYQLNYMPSGNAAEYELLQTILSGLATGAAICGWGNGEDAILAAIAKHGAYLQCDSVPNLSFHRAVKPYSPRMPYKKSTFDPGSVQLENKYYVAFMINEGDTLKCMGSFYNGGQWSWPERGQVPINWGNNPAIVEEYPSLMEAIYSTMSDKDLFFSAVTGYGYYNPKYSSGLAYFTKKERETAPLGHMTVGSVYSVHNMNEAANGILDTKTDRWLVDRGCEGYVFESAQQAYLKFTSAMQPLIGVDWSLFYWRFRYDKGADPVQGAIDRIKSLADEHPAPFLIPVYAGSPGEFKRMADALPAVRFKVVLLDEMVELAKRIGQSQLSRERLVMKGDTSREVELTVRNWQKEKRSGVVEVKKPQGWIVKPQDWTYSDLGERETKVRKFEIHVPESFVGTDQVTFTDQGAGRVMKLSVTRQAIAETHAKPPLARSVIAAHGSPTIDGKGDDWNALGSTVIDHDLGKLGSFRAQYRMSWDDQYLYFLIEEMTPPARANESYGEIEFGGGEFKNTDGISFWMDFAGKGTTKNGGFTPRFGFSSTTRTDLYTCTINDRVLVSARPKAIVATAGGLGNRVIEAAIRWCEIDSLLDEEHLPYGGLQKALRSGLGFGCQPLLIEDGKHQGYLNGFSWATKGAASVLEKKQANAGPPSGSDKESLWVELK
jgi:hypothetical protein